MGDTTQYIIVIAAYFVAMIAIGVVFSKRISSESDYFVARDQLSPLAIGFSFSATQMSGSTYLGTVGTVRGIGYAFIPGALSSAAAPWFAYILLGDRVRQVSARLKSVTLADIFEARYGKTAGLYATILTMVCLIPLIAGQLKAAGNSFEVLLGLPYLTAIILFGGIVIVYTLLGGMFAVAWTDFVQGLLMILGIFIMVPICVGASGGLTAMHETYAAWKPENIRMFGGQPYLWVVSGFLVWGFFQIGGNPAACTRFLTTSDDKVMKKALVYSIIFESIIFLGVSLLALCSVGLIDDPPSSDMVLPMLIDKFLPAIVGGVVLAAALGAMMSTVDSVLLVISSLFVNNIMVKRMGEDAGSKKALNAGRIVTVVAGLLAFVCVINPPDAILWIITTGFSIMAAAYTFPLLLGLWWPAATKQGGLAGMISGTVVALLWYVLGYVQYQSLSSWPGGIWPAMIGAAVSLIVCIVVSKATKHAKDEDLAVFFEGAPEAK